MSGSQNVEIEVETKVEVEPKIGAEVRMEGA